MKKYKAVLSLLMVVTLLFTSTSFGGLALASEPKTDKEIFAENCDRIYWSNRLLAKNTLQENHTEECYMAISMYVANDYENLAKIIRGNNEQTRSSSEQITLDELETYLNASGMFIYNKEGTVPSITPCSSSEAVKLNKVLITYNSSASEWVVSGGGSWINDSAIRGDVPFDLLSHVGKKVNIGGQDAVGVALYNVSGTKPVLKRSQGYVHDGHGNNKNLYSRSNLDATRGVVFPYQDVYTMILPTIGYYLGYGFSATAVYNSNFSKYNGLATSYYAHSWSDTNINSIGLSTTGFNISWTEKKNSWSVHGSNDVAF